VNSSSYANPIVLLTQHVTDALGAWEARALQHRSALEGLVGCKYLSAWEAALRSIAHAATTTSSSSMAGGASGSSGSSGGNAGLAAALPFLDCPPERRVLWRLLLSGRTGAAAPVALSVEEADAAWVQAVNAGGRHLQPVAQQLAAQLSAYATAAAAASSDPHAKPTTAAAVRRLQRALEKRHKALSRDAAGHEGLLSALGLAPVSYACEAARHRVEVVRLYRDLHVAELQVEVRGVRCIASCVYVVYVVCV